MLASTVLMTALFAGLAQAGWNGGSAKVDQLCNNNGRVDRACFTTDADLSSPGSGSDFSGYLSDDNKRFVIYQDGKNSAFLQTDKYIINVQFTGAGAGCAAADIQTTSGQVVDNGIFCGSSSRWLHIPA